MRSPLVLLLSRLDSHILHHSSELLQSSPPTSFVIFSSHTSATQDPPCIEGLQNWTEYSRYSLISAVYKGTVISLVLQITLFLMQARMPLAFLASWAQCWLMFAWAAFQSLFPMPLPLHGVVVTQSAALGIQPSGCHAIWTCPIDSAIYLHFALWVFAFTQVIDSQILISAASLLFIYANA